MSTGLDEEWITPQQAAKLLGVSTRTIYTYACKFEWDTKMLGANAKAGVLYWGDGRSESRWDDAR